MINNFYLMKRRYKIDDLRDYMDKGCHALIGYDVLNQYSNKISPFTSLKDDEKHSRETEEDIQAILNKPWNF